MSGVWLREMWRFGWMGAYGREEDVTKKAWVKSGTEYIRREIWWFLTSGILSSCACSTARILILPKLSFNIFYSANGCPSTQTSTSPSATHSDNRKQLYCYHQAIEAPPENVFHLAFSTTFWEATLPAILVYFREQSSVEVPGSMHSQGAMQGVGRK